MKKAFIRSLYTLGDFGILFLAWPGVLYMVIQGWRTRNGYRDPLPFDNHASSVAIILSIVVSPVVYGSAAVLYYFK